LGDLFYAGTLGYFAMYRAMSALQAQQAQMRHDLMPSVGTYGLGATVTRFFGVPRTMSASGIIMDIGNLATLSTDLAGSKDARLNFVGSAGMLSSALEHVVPEQMFSTPTAPVSAISAVKALQIAAQQGIPVHHIDATNAATVVPLLSGIDPVALEEIQAALAQGKEVTVSQSNITANGWTGVGYIITDPVTGSGAYKISTGKNGSAMYWGKVYGALIALEFFLFTQALKTANPAAISTTFFALICAITMAKVVHNVYMWSGGADVADCFAKGLLAMFADVLSAFAVGLSIDALYGKSNGDNNLGKRSNVILVATQWIAQLFGRVLNSDVVCTAESVY